MLFYNPVFLFLFLPATFGLWLVADRFWATALRWHIVTAASLIVFYGYYRWDYVFLLVVSMVANYGFARLIISSQLRKSKLQAQVILGTGIGINIGCLAVFKYGKFFIVNTNAVLGTSLLSPEITLPLAISFYTFQQIAYLVDVYRDRRNGVTVAEYGFFTTFFPHLIAGPICHSNDIVPQMPMRRTAAETWSDVQVGSAIFVIGLFKKVVISGLFSPMADAGFAAGATLDAASAWTATLAYSFNIYFDFSAYSDMALGLGLMFGIRLPLNFYSPYKASSIIEFWRCWHITLSRFLRDYLYIPMGGNRRGRLRAVVNLFVVMLLAGLWHGANWTFVLWGGIHGLMLALNHAWRAWFGHRADGRSGPLAYVTGCALTFLLVTLAWIPFKATSLEQTGNVFMALWHLSGTLPKPTDAAALVFGLAIIWLLPNTVQLTRQFVPACTVPPHELSFEKATPRWFSFQPNWQWAFGTAAMIFFVVHASIDRGVDTFIYFKF